MFTEKKQKQRTLFVRIEDPTKLNTFLNTFYILDTNNRAHSMTPHSCLHK